MNEISKENPPLHPSQEGNTKSPLPGGDLGVGADQEGDTGYTDESTPCTPASGGQCPPLEGVRGRSYTRQTYQNLMSVVEYLESKSPLTASQRQMQTDLKLTKSVIFDVCWNLVDRGWAEDVGEGNIKLKSRHSNIDAIIGKEVRKIVETHGGASPLYRSGTGA